MAYRAAIVLAGATLTLGVAAPPGEATAAGWIFLTGCSTALALRTLITWQERRRTVARRRPRPYLDDRFSAPPPD